VSELKHQISLLIAWMDQNEECPVWERIRIHDTTHPDVCWKPEILGWQVTRESLVTPEDYEQQFHTLVQAGYSWINLSLYGVHEDMFGCRHRVVQRIEQGSPGQDIHQFLRTCDSEWKDRLAASS